MIYVSVQPLWFANQDFQSQPDVNGCSAGMEETAAHHPSQPCGSSASFPAHQTQGTKTGCISLISCPSLSLPPFHFCPSPPFSPPLLSFPLHLLSSRGSSSLFLMAHVSRPTQIYKARHLLLMLDFPLPALFTQNQCRVT